MHTNNSDAEIIENFGTQLMIRKYNLITVKLHTFLLINCKNIKHLGESNISVLLRK